jgi:tellurite resistance protein
MGLLGSVTSMRAQFKDITVTPPLFGIAFGFAGLSGTWRETGRHSTSVVANLLAGVSAVLAVALAIPWITQLARRETDLRTELRDPALGPSVPALPIAAMLLSSTLLATFTTVGRTLVALFAFLTLVGGLAVVTAWVVSRLPLRKYHPGFYLPTAGGTLLSAQCVTYLGWVGLAQALFFIGLGSWVSLGLVTSLRLARSPLPPAMRPVLAIEVAAPALAGNAYAVVFNRFDGYALALAAVTAIMGIVQVGLIPYYRRAPFGPAFWTAAFSYATTATLALRWINHEHPTGADLWRTLTLAVATGVVVLLSGASVVAIGRAQFFTRRPAHAVGALDRSGR